MVEINPKSVSPKVSDPILDAIHAIGNAGFSNLLQEAEEGDLKPRIVQVGELTYKVVSDDEHLEALTTEKLKTSVTGSGGSEEAAKSDAKADTTPVAPVESKSEVGSSGVHPGIPIFLNPVDPQAFLSKLPHSLQSFIEETVSIVRQRDGITDDLSYRFQFAKLNLDVSLTSADNKFVVEITIRDQGLSMLFSEENQQLLFQALQAQFPDEDIELVIQEDFDGIQPDSDGQSSQDQQRESQSDDAQDEDDQ